MDSKEIIKDAMKLETPPRHYNLLEIQCFLSIKQLVIMFNNKQITTENASETKRLIITKYEKNVEKIKNVESLMINLKNILNGEEEKEVTKESVQEALNTSFKLIKAMEELYGKQ